MNWQTDRIDHHVFPIISVKNNSDEIKSKQIHGTGFIIDSSGYVLTAAHVIDNKDCRKYYSIFPINNEWRAFPLTMVAKHDVKDVAMLKIDAGEDNEEKFKTIFHISEGFDVRATFKYRSFGYPRVAWRNSIYNISCTPDLIYTEGYVRRNYSHSFPNGLKTKDLFELSEVGGSGYSGSPIIDMRRNKQWEVVGIYVGERCSEMEEGKYRFGCALKTKAFYAWALTNK